MKTSKNADEKFSKAVEMLTAYEERYHPYINSVQDRMNKAKENDKSSSGILSWLKANEQVIEIRLRFITV
jgi:hypothetical protein